MLSYALFVILQQFFIYTYNLLLSNLSRLMGPAIRYITSW